MVGFKYNLVLTYSHYNIVMLQFGHQTSGQPHHHDVCSGLHVHQQVVRTNEPPLGNYTATSRSIRNNIRHANFACLIQSKDVILYEYFCCLMVLCFIMRITSSILMKSSIITVIAFTCTSVNIHCRL